MSDVPIKRVRGLDELPTGPGGPEPAEGPPAPEAASPAPDLTRPPASPAPTSLTQPPAATSAGPRGPVPTGPRADRDREAAPARPAGRGDDGPAPRSVRDVDDDLDAELARAFGGRGTAGIDTNFKRTKDDDIEAELESMMEGFDPLSLTASNAGPRSRAADRAGQPKEGIGQEDRSGVQRAKVVAVRGNVAFLDLGAKSEGIVPLDQFGDNPPAVGDTVEVVFERFDKAEGLLVMSRQGAAVIANWENLKKGLIVEARGVKSVKGGLEVEVNGIRGFMPISQIELGHVEDAATYVNQKLRCLVTEASQRDRNLVVSRRSLLEKERAEKREKTWAELEEGQVRSGVVRSIKPFGAFVDLGGVDGLILVQNLAWGRVKDPGEVVTTGQEVEVQVLKIDRDTQRVSLGLKQLKESPWDTLAQQFHVGQYVKAKVTRLMEFGAFAEITPGIEGLIHISELGPKKVWRVKDVVQEGQEVDVRILRIEPEARRISLSLKPAGPATEAPVDAEAFDPADGPPPTEVKPRFDLPLRGGLGDRDPNPFSKPPR